MMHKAGFVNIIGKPNAGKSTLLNSLLKEKLAIVTHKAQTTRHRILGIISEDNYQIVLSDTPGIVVNPVYKLHENMLNKIHEALKDADIVILIVDVNNKNLDLEILKGLKESKVPVIVLINKIDTSSQETVNEVINEFAALLPGSEVIAISALLGFNTEELINKMLSYLPEHPSYYPEDYISDKSERFIAAEMIREKILLNYREEIPYSVEVQIESFKDEAEIVRIYAMIYIERESQKQILIGKGGRALKNVGVQARKDMEAFFQKKVFLQLFVKVRKDWRNNTELLRRFGY